MPMLADTLERAIYGGIVGSAGASDASGSKRQKTTENASESSAGAGTGIAWAIGILAAGLLIFMVYGKRQDFSWRELFGMVGAGVKTFAGAGLNGGTTYRFRVRAFHSGGNSAYSSIVNATTY